MTEQSDFSLQQEITQAPPEVLAQEALNRNNHYHQKNRPYYYLVIILGIIFCLLLLVLQVIGHRTPEEQPQVVPPTQAPEAPVQSTIVELARLKDLVDLANPSENDFPPPEVDMNVAF